MKDSTGKKLIRATTPGRDYGTVFEVFCAGAIPMVPKHKTYQAVSSEGTGAPRSSVTTANDVPSRSTRSVVPIVFDATPEDGVGYDYSGHDARLARSPRHDARPMHKFRFPRRKSVHKK